jgi:hypothetical protein
MVMLDFNEIDEFQYYKIDDFEGHEEFKKFLEDNGVLDSFVEEFYKSDNDDWKINYWVGYKENKDNYTLHDFLDNLDKGNNMLDCINYAFDWDVTKEGRMFWYWINKEWNFDNYRYV